MSTTVASPITSELTPVRDLALRDARTVVPGMIPFGIMLGVTVLITGANPPFEIIGDAAIYGGSAQLAAITLLDNGVGLAAAVVTSAAVNARLFVYSAALGPRFRDQPRLFRWLGPVFLIDQTFPVVSGRPALSGADFRRYWRWLGGSVLVVWTASIALGTVLAPVIPPLPHLALVGTAMFIGLLAPRRTDRPALLAAVVGGAVSTATSLVLPASGIIAGALAGVAAALAATSLTSDPSRQGDRA